MSNTASVIDTPEGIAFINLCRLRGALRLEVVGLTGRGQSAYSQAKALLKVKGNKKKVLDALNAHIEKVRPQPAAA